MDTRYAGRVIPPILNRVSGIFVSIFKKGNVKSMMKAMLSQPMAGKGYEVINMLFTDEWFSEESMKECRVANKPFCFLAKSLENMSLCHTAYFCEGWGKHEAANWNMI